MMKTLTIFGLVSSLSQPALAQSCFFKSEAGEKEKITVELLGTEFEILRLRFSGPKADEYYALKSHSKPDGTTKEFVQFATRPSRGEPLALQVRKPARFFYTMLKGANHYEWQPHGKKNSITIECSDAQ